MPTYKIFLEIAKRAGFEKFSPIVFSFNSEITHPRIGPGVKISLLTQMENFPMHCSFQGNGYNGTILWERALEPGFNIHRNTMIATPDILYLADSKSCKLLDASTGRLKSEIVAPPGATGPVWKWMAAEDGVLYAMVGEEEFRDRALRGSRTLPGWPWKPMTDGYDAA